MKIIFLDIDGVLNSSKYEPKTINNQFRFIDETRMPLLKEIVDKTGAQIVLSSTWRDCWNKDYNLCDNDGKYLTNLFKKYGLTILDTTLVTPNYYQRPKEISVYIADAKYNIENYVVIDDDEFDWGYHSDRVVKTNPRNDYGLNENLTQKAISILNK